MPTSNSIDEVAFPFRALLGALPDPVVLIERGGALVASNAAWSELILEASSDVAPASFKAGSPWLREFAAMFAGAAEDHDALAEGLRAVGAAERPRFDLDHVYSRGGEARCLSLTISSLRIGYGGRDGEVDGVLIQARRATELLLRRKAEAELRDVTERERAELSVRESDERFRLLAELTSEAVVLTENGVLIDVNSAMSDMVGRTREELVGRSALEVLDPECHDRVRHAIATSSEKPYEVTAVHRDGTKIPALVRGRVLPYRGRMVRGTTIRDLRLQRQMDEALRAKIAQETELAAQAAALAELSTPLIPISDRVVVMPLIGSVDSQRASRVVEALLRGVAESRASVAILDITGVPAVDSHIADALVRAARAVRLIGAEVVLTGIRPEVARTLVTLGVDLSDIPTRGSLRSGIAYAESRALQRLAR